MREAEPDNCPAAPTADQHATEATGESSGAAPAQVINNSILLGSMHLYMYVYHFFPT